MYLPCLPSPSWGYMAFGLTRRNPDWWFSRWAWSSLSRLCGFEMPAKLACPLQFPASARIIWTPATTIPAWTRSPTDNSDSFWSNAACCRGLIIYVRNLIQIFCPNVEDIPYKYALPWKISASWNGQKGALKCIAYFQAFDSKFMIDLFT